MNKKVIIFSSIIIVIILITITILIINKPKNEININKNNLKNETLKFNSVQECAKFYSYREPYMSEAVREDNCYIDLIVDKKATEECDDEENYLGRNDIELCRTTIKALSEHNIKICNEGDLFWKGYCYGKVSVSIGNKSECYNGPNVIDSFSKLEVSKCLSMFGIYFNNSDICAEIDPPKDNSFNSEQEDCFKSIAIINKDPDVCQKFVDHESENTPIGLECYYDYALYYLNKTICSKIQSRYYDYYVSDCIKKIELIENNPQLDWLKYGSWENLAKASENVSLCNNYQSLYDTESCKNEYNNRLNV